MRSNKDLTLIEVEGFSQYEPKFKNNFNRKKFIATCKKNRKLRKKKKK